ncbi:MAG: asparagine synthase C-terminal domain-containing protein [Archaeoglobaceae archaeon]
MSIYAFADMEGGRAVRINVNASFPSKQNGNVFLDSRQPVNLKFADELPLHIEDCFSLVAFRPSHVLISRDVLGGKPLYYEPSKLAFSSFSSLLDQPVELHPGETLKIDYEGNVLSRNVYQFEDIFYNQVEDPVRAIEKALNSFFHADSCVAFSGGVDSSLLAAIYDVPLVSVTANPEEKEWVEKAAGKLGKEVDVFVFGEEEVMEALSVVVPTIETTDPVQVSIAIPLYFTLKFARELGHNSVIFGQGADELFGGYSRYQNMDIEKLESSLIQDIKNVGRHDLSRDVKLAYKLEMEAIYPYLQWEVIRAAIKIPPEQKIKSTENGVIRKYALRKLASRYLPQEVAFKDKKSVQYSTKTTAILKKLAKREGLYLNRYLHRFETNGSEG